MVTWITIIDQTIKDKFKLYQKFIIAIIILGISGLIFTSLYVQWTTCGSDSIAGIQGRYFIPILPLFILLIGSQLKIKTPYNDKNINKYISHNFISFLDKHEAKSDDKMEIGKAYVVNKDKKNIGVVGTLDMSSTGVVEVWYSIDKDLRGKGYGEKVLAQVTPYLIENIKFMINLLAKYVNIC